jgi:hypothetical protein
MTIPNSSMTTYMKGTRRIDEMAANARQLAFQENYSYTEGWDDNTVGEIFNLGLNQLYDKITQVDSVANIEEFSTTVFAGVQSYPIPQHVKMAIQIMNVRYLYGPETWQFVTLEQGMIQDRYSYPTNIPSTYCIRNGFMLLSPTPNITRENALIVNYQKRMRSLDYRRGKVSNIISPFGNVASIDVISGNIVQVTTASPHGMTTGMKSGLGGVFTPSELIDNTYIITVTGPTTYTLNNVDGTYFSPFTGTAIWYQNPVQFQLNFSISSQKDVNLQANANSILDKVDWICFTDRNGERVIDAIPINNYNQTTFVITCDPNYVIPYADWLNFQALIANQDTFYVITGDYASTHSQLDRQSEDLLVEYTVLRLLRLQSAAEPTQSQLDAEEKVLDRIAIAYRRYRPSVVPIIWQQRLRTRSWFWGGRGPY